jgi:hypothetical protein
MLAASRRAGDGLTKRTSAAAAYVLRPWLARVRCNACDDELVVDFPCKRRGICPSCTARRMADTAAHLVDRVLPLAPYRQWGLSAPKPLRLRLARAPEWASWVGKLAVRAIGAWQRRIARARGARDPRTGEITFVQRFGAWSTSTCTSTSSPPTACSSTTTGAGSRSCCTRCPRRRPARDPRSDRASRDAPAGRRGGRHVPRGVPPRTRYEGGRCPRCNSRPRPCLVRVSMVLLATLRCITERAEQFDELICLEGIELCRRPLGKRVCIQYALGNS